MTLGERSTSLEAQDESQRSPDVPGCIARRPSSINAGRRSSEEGVGSPIAIAESGGD